mgnify:CR=1 FL=1
MALGDNNGRSTYLNIKKGKIAYKVNGENKESDFIEGFITKISIVEKEYEGKKYEEANINITDGDEKYQLQMKVDSGYFRAFCNAFKSGNPNLKTKITPTFEEKGAKKNSGCFVEQEGASLKWFYSKANDNLTEIPQLESTVFGGKTLYDGSKLLAFWKNWLLSLKFNQIVSDEAQDNGLNKEKPKAESKEKKEKAAEKAPSIDSKEEDLDLPF